MADPFAHLAPRYDRHLTQTLRGRVRLELIWRQVLGHLPQPPAAVVDIGGGAGQMAARLTGDGYDVTLLDPSAEMLREARSRLGERVRLVRGRGQDAVRLLGAQSFDAAFCHGVVMYADDPGPLYAALAGVLAPGGMVSLVAKNASSLAMRAGLERRWRDAVAAFDVDRDIGGMGVVTRGDTFDGLRDALACAGLRVEQWYGVRVLTDHLGDEPPGDDLADVVAAEGEAGRRDPYRRIARLLHVVARRPATEQQPATGSAPYR